MAEDVAEEIRTLEVFLQEATLKNDVETTDSLLADNWLNINANGTVTSKEQSLQVMGRFQFISIENEEVHVRVYPGTAVVTGKSTRKLQRAGDQVAISKVRFTRVYAQPEEGRWRVVSSQATPIAQ